MHKKVINRNIVLYMAGQLVSLLGTNIYSFVVGLYIMEITGSALSFGLSFVLNTLPRVIFGTISGVVMDRINKKKAVVGLDLLCAIILLATFSISSFSGLSIISLYVTIFLLSICNTFFYTAMMSSIPSFTDKENMIKVNSLGNMSSSVASICAPFLGGILISLIDIKVFLFIDAITFLFSALSETFIDFTVGEKEEKCIEAKTSKSSFINDYKEGFQYVKSQKWISSICCFVLLLNSLLIVGLEIGVPYIAKQVLGFTSQQYGFLNISYPLGVFVASLMLSVVKQPKNSGKRIIKCISIIGLALIFMGVIVSGKIHAFNNVEYLLILSCMYLVIAVAETFVNVPVFTMIQKMVDRDKIGRVQGIISTLILGLAPVSSIVGGFLLDIITPWILQVACGAGMLLLIGFMLKNEKIKSI